MAIAAAVEDEKYPVEELIVDLANLRAGHRFRGYASTESRLAMVCRGLRITRLSWVFEGRFTGGVRRWCYGGYS